MPRKSRWTKYGVGISVGYRRDRQTWVIRFEIDGQDWIETFERGPAGESLAHAAAKVYQRRRLDKEDIRPDRIKAKAGADGTIARNLFRVLGDQWLVDGAANRKPTTNRFYDGNLRRYLYPKFGDLIVNDANFNRDVCVAYARHLIKRLSQKDPKGKQAIKRGTRAGILRTLSSFLTWCYEKKHLSGNPAFRLLKYTINPDEPLSTIVFWTPAECERLLAACKKHAPFWYDFLFFVLRTGLRAGEVVELRWAEDFKVPGVVQIQRQWSVKARDEYAINPVTGAREILDQDADEAAGQVTPPKGKQRRNVRLDGDVQLLLPRRRAERRKAAMKAGVPVPELVFTGPEFARVNVGNFEQRVLGYLCQRARVPYTTSLHACRHTFATILLNGGEDMNWVSLQLGHQHYTTTDRTYRHHITDNDRRDSERGARIAAAWSSE